MMPPWLFATSQIDQVLWASIAGAFEGEWDSSSIPKRAFEPTGSVGWELSALLSANR